VEKLVENPARSAVRAASNQGFQAVCTTMVRAADANATL
jgi:hypothetical protein